MQVNAKISFMIAYLIFFALAVIIFGQNIAPAATQNAFRIIEGENALKLTNLAYLVIGLIIAVLYAGSNWAIEYGNLPESKLYFPFKFKRFKNGKVPLRGTLYDKRGRIIPFTKVTLYGEDEQGLGYTYSNVSGKFSFRLKPGSYLLQSTCFDLESEMTKLLKIDKGARLVLTEVTACAKDDAILDPPAVGLARFLKICLAVLMLAGPFIAFENYAHQAIFMPAVIAIFAITLAYIFSLRNFGHLAIIDQSGKKLANTKIIISGVKNKKKVAGKTDYRGRVTFLGGEGIYKVTAEGQISRNFRLTSRELANFEIKLS